LVRASHELLVDADADVLDPDLREPTLKLESVPVPDVELLLFSGDDNAVVID
jgi:hypothetical protein